MLTNLLRILLLVAALAVAPMVLVACGDDVDTNGEDGGDGNKDGDKDKDDDALCDPDSTEPLHACSEFTKNCTPFDNARVPRVNGEIPHP